MAAMTEVSLAAFRFEDGSRRGWLPLIAGLVAGAALLFCLARAEGADPVPVAPADRPAAPPAPLNQKPYAPPIRIGLMTHVPISGVSAPFRGSAAFWRDGESS
jgi:hypothetical protein